MKLESSLLQAKNAYKIEAKKPKFNPLPDDQGKISDLLKIFEKIEAILQKINSHPLSFFSSQKKLSAPQSENLQKTAPTTIMGTFYGDIRNKEEIEQWITSKTKLVHYQNKKPIFFQHNNDIYVYSDKLDTHTKLVFPEVFSLNEKQKDSLMLSIKLPVTSQPFGDSKDQPHSPYPYPCPVSKMVVDEILTSNQCLTTDDLYCLQFLKRTDLQIKIENISDDEIKNKMTALLQNYQNAIKCHYPSNADDKNLRNNFNERKKIIGKIKSNSMSEPIENLLPTIKHS